jgi:hypothetical protein
VRFDFARVLPVPRKAGAPPLDPPGVYTIISESTMWRLAILAALLAAGPSLAYYIPGTYPQEFWPGDVLNGERGGGGRPSRLGTALMQPNALARAVQVNSLTSFDTEMPFEYYVMASGPGGRAIARGARSASTTRARAADRRRDLPAATRPRRSSMALGSGAWHAASALVVRQPVHGVSSGTHAAKGSRCAQA